MLTQTRAHGTCIDLAALSTRPSTEIGETVVRGRQHGAIADLHEQEHRDRTA